MGILRKNTTALFNLSVLDFGERGKRFMKKKTSKYSDEPIGNVKVISDFLPNPKDLALKEETVKVTISLTKESIDFFKNQAEIHHTNYQKMIRELLNQYSEHYKNSPKANTAKSIHK